MTSAFGLHFSKSDMTLARKGTRPISANLFTSSIIFQAFVFVSTRFPIRGQIKALRTQTKYLTVTIDAFVRAASIVVVAAMGALTSVTILVQKGASHGLTRALVATLCIGTNILTGSMTVI